MAPGDALAEIETDKASMTFECQDDLFIAKLLVSEAELEIPVGGAIMVTVENHGDVAAFSDFTISDLPSNATEPNEEKTSIEIAPSLHTPAMSSSKTGKLSPAAAHMVKSQNISFENVVGTARGKNYQVRLDIITSRQVNCRRRWPLKI